MVFNYTPPPQGWDTVLSGIQSVSLPGLLAEPGPPLPAAMGSGTVGVEQTRSGTFLRRSWPLGSRSWPVCWGKAARKGLTHLQLRVAAVAEEGLRLAPP